MCKSPVGRNTDALVDSLTPAIAQDADGSLAALNLSPEQAVADLAHLRQLIQARQPEQHTLLKELHRRYVGAPPPRKDQPASLAYRLRLLFLDRWNLWPRLTRYRTWHGPQDERPDGTNNACERAIGWWVKERYRTMRGDKRTASVLNVSRLIAWAGSGLDGGGVDLALVVQ